LIKEPRMPRKAKASASKGGKKGGRKALGMGLSALLPPAPPAAPQASVDPESERKGVFECGLDAIHPNPDQPRKHFNDERLDELAESIRHLGVLQPLLVRAVESGYEIVLGERRYRAAGRLGLDKVPVQIVDADDVRAFQMALVENIQREDLGPLEEADAYRRLVEDFGLKQEQVAQRVGKDRSTVANALRILRLPPSVKIALAEGKLTAGHARPLLSLPPDRVEQVSRQVIAKGLSVRATEALVRRLRDAAESDSSGPVKEKSPQVRDLEDRLCRSLGTRVLLKTRNKTAGRIEISYHDLDELDRLLDVLL
jgi:ParB family transcriptional regulator, chromosome partitioning protein